MMHATRSALISLSIWSVLSIQQLSVVTAKAATTPTPTDLPLPLPPTEYGCEESDSFLKPLIQLSGEEEWKKKWQQLKVELNTAYKKQQYRKALRLVKDSFVLGADTDSNASNELIDESDVRILRADVFAKLGQFDRAKPIYARFIASSADVPLSFKPEYTIRALNGLAEIGMTEGRFEDANSYIDQAIARSTKNGLNDETAIASKILRGKLLWKQLKLKESETVFEEVQTDAKKLKPVNKALLAESFEGLALISNYRNNSKVALEKADNALALRMETFGEESLEVASSMGTLARIYQFTDPARSNQLRLKALSIQTKILGTSAHPLVAYTLLSLSYSFSEPYSVRESMCSTALHSVDGILGSESPFMAAYLARLAEINLYQDKLLPAIENANRAIQIQNKLYGPNSLHEADCLHTISAATQSDKIKRAFATNKYEGGIPCKESTELIERAIRIANDRLGLENYKSGMYMQSLTSIKYTENNFVDTETYGKKCLEILTRTVPEKDSRLDLPKKLLVNAYIKTGKLKEAREILLGLINQRVEERGLCDKELLHSLLPELDKTHEKTLPDRSTQGESLLLCLVQKLPAEETGLLGTMSMLLRHYQPPSFSGLRGINPDPEIVGERALKERLRAYGDDSPEIADALLQQAENYEASGKREVAEKIYLRVIAIQENGLGKNHPCLIKTLSEYADLLIKMEKQKEADAIRTRCEEIKKSN